MLPNAPDIGFNLFSSKELTSPKSIQHKAQQQKIFATLLQCKARIEYQSREMCFYHSTQNKRAQDSLAVEDALCDVWSGVVRGIPTPIADSLLHLQPLFGPPEPCQ